MRKLIQINRFLLIVLSVSFLALMVSFCFEILLGSTPCLLCRFQRIFFVIGILFCLTGLFIEKKEIALGCIAFFFFAAAILSLYHFMIQLGIFADPCRIQTVNTIEEFHKMLQLKSPCRDSTTYILGIPLSFINALLFSSLTFTAIKLLRQDSLKQM
jgi:disulfide bond formation protein DsbB